MRTTLVVISSALLGFAAAATIENRAACNRDDCFRAVLASSHSPGPAAASADCSSFFQKTVTYCTVTTTTTATATVTAQALTVTTIIPSTSVTTLPITDLETLSTTVTTTQTVQLTSLTTVTEVSGTTATVDFTTTITTTLVNPNGPAKRDVTTAGGSCPISASPTIIIPTIVPTYASACSGTARYSSACSCDGITQATTTIPQSTRTVTVTTTMTITPTSTFVTQSIVLVTQTSIVTSDVHATEIDTAFTTIATTIPSTVTIVTSATISSAVATEIVTRQQSSPYFYLQAHVNGVIVGYVNYNQSNFDYPLLINSDKTLDGHIDDQGRLHYFPGRGIWASVAGTGNDIIYATLASHVPLYCTLSNYAAASGSFYCAVGDRAGPQSVFNYCANNNNYLYISTAARVGCQVITLTAVPSH